jgi:hypothetical protein
VDVVVVVVVGVVVDGVPLDVVDVEDCVVAVPVEGVDRGGIVKPLRPVILKMNSKISSHVSPSSH